MKMPVSVLTQHNDTGRSGANLNETVLNTSNVNLNRFGKLFVQEVVGQIYAQPLYVPLVRIITHGVDKGVHNIVVVVTMENWVYAFDADDNEGTNTGPLWGHHLQQKPPVPATIYRRGYQDIIGNIGILSTPVIDAQIGTSHANPSAGVMYLVLATWDPVLFKTQPQKAFQHLLYALNLADGQPLALPGGKSNPVAIVGSVPGQGYHNRLGRFNVPLDDRRGHPELQEAREDEHSHDIVLDRPFNSIKLLPIKDGHNGTPTARVEFSSMQQIQRPGLLLLDGVVYCAFGSHGDFNPYHGWVFAYDVKTLEQKGVFCTTPNGAQAGIWQAGEGLVADETGSIYLGTGNGDFQPNIGGDPDLGECFIKLKLTPGGPSASGTTMTRLALTGWFNAFKDPEQPPERRDEDLGAASPTLLPDGRLVGGGKDGRFFLLDPTKMDRSGTRAALVQSFKASFDAKSLLGFTYHIHGSPIMFDSPEHGPLVYVWGENEVLRAYAYDPSKGGFPGQPGPGGGQGIPTARGTTIASNDRPGSDKPQGEKGGMPGAMLSLSANGKVPSTGIVWASFPPYDNANQQTVLGELRAYDASRFDSHGPQDRLVTLWSSRFNPQRDHYGNFPKFCCPTIANGKVYQATFNQPGQLWVYGLLKRPNGGYNLGFGGTTGLTLNGGARVDHTHIRLTEVPHKFQASSVFCTEPVNVTQFQTIFRFQLTAAQADGFTFTIQGEGPHALGGPGGGLGYGPDPIDPNDPGFRITHSVAVKFDLFDNRTLQPTSTTGLCLDSIVPNGGPLDGIDLHSGHPCRVTMQYDGRILSVTIKDEVTNVSATQQYPIDIPAHTGSVAHVGFTGGTGGATARQDILSWQFTS